MQDAVWEACKMKFKIHAICNLGSMQDEILRFMQDANSGFMQDEILRFMQDANLGFMQDAIWNSCKIKF